MQLVNIRIQVSGGFFPGTWCTTAATLGIKFWVTCLLCISLLQCPMVRSRPRHGGTEHQEAPPADAEDGAVWLVGGKSPGTGNVLVYHQGEWGSVCDDGWNQESAHIICRSIGHPYALGYTNQAYFGKPKQSIQLDDIRCYGDEKSILECNTAEWGVHNCDRREAAGVYCAPKTMARLRTTAKATTTATTKSTTKTTTTTTTTTTRRPLVTSTITPYNTDKKTTVLVPTATVEHFVHSLSPEEIQKATELLKTAADVDVEVDNSENEVREDLKRDDISRDSNEISILESDTDITGTLAGNATTREAEEILAKRKKAQDKKSKKKATKEDTFLKEENVVERQKPHHTHSPGPYDLKIVDGRNPSEGRVEVLLNGVWGVICSDNWSLLEARVACNQAGLGYAKMAARGTYFGGSTKPKVVAGIKCDGLEDRLSDCYHEQFGDVLCPEAQYIAGVVCSFKLPDLVPNGTLLETSSYLQDQPMHYIQCAMEEGCAASSAYHIKSTQRDWGNHRRRLLRFSSSTWNFGTADFHPFRPKNTWEWHMCHMHYHSMDVFANYDLLDFNHNRVAEGHKASFCLEDVECLPDKAKRYECVGFSDQGISVGCADNYKHNIDCQWIDVTDVKPGKYIFRVHINPEFKVAELDYQNNAVTCDLEYTGYTVIVNNCINGPGDHLPRRP